MADWEDARRLAMAMPRAEEREGPGGVLQWRVAKKLFVWERPLRGSDLEALGDAAPRGPVLGARVADLGDKEALIAQDASMFFTTPHFNGYPAILVRLDAISPDVLAEVVQDAWLSRAPKRLAAEYLNEHNPTAD